MINCTISHTWVVIGVAVTTIRVIGVVVTRLVGSGSADFLRHLENYFLVFSGQRFRLEWLSSCHSQLRLILKESGRITSLHDAQIILVECRRLTHRKIPWRRALSSFAFISTEQDPSDSHLEWTFRQRCRGITAFKFRQWMICCQANSANKSFVELRRLEIGTSAACDLNFFQQAIFMTHVFIFLTFELSKEN